MKCYMKIYVKVHSKIFNLLANTGIYSEGLIKRHKSNDQGRERSVRAFSRADEVY